MPSSSSDSQPLISYCVCLTIFTNTFFIRQQCLGNVKVSPLVRARRLPWGDGMPRTGTQASACTGSIALRSAAAQGGKKDTITCREERNIFIIDVFAPWQFGEMKVGWWSGRKTRSRCFVETLTHCLGKKWKRRSFVAVSIFLLVYSLKTITYQYASLN